MPFRARRTTRTAPLVENGKINIQASIPNHIGHMNVNIPNEKIFREKAQEFVALVKRYGFRPLDEENKDTIESFVERSMNFAKNKQVLSSLVYSIGPSSSLDCVV